MWQTYEWSSRVKHLTIHQFKQPLVLRDSEPVIISPDGKPPTIALPDIKPVIVLPNRQRASARIILQASDCSTRQ